MKSYGVSVIEDIIKEINEHLLGPENAIHFTFTQTDNGDELAFRKGSVTMVLNHDREFVRVHGEGGDDTLTNLLKEDNEGGD